MKKDRCSNYNKLVKLENNVCSRGGAHVKLLGRYVHPCVWQIGVLELNFASKDKHPEQKCQELATSNLGFEANLLISFLKTLLKIGCAHKK